MTDTACFLKNLALLEDQLLKPLQHRPQDFENLDLKILQGALYSQKLEKKIDESISLESPLETDIFCIYGLGLGHALKHLNKWLEEDASRFVVFIEDDKASLRFFLEQETSTKVLQNPQVLIYFIETEEELCDELSELNWFCAQKKRILTACSFYQEHKQDAFEKISYILQSRKPRIEGILKEGLDYAQIFSNNFYRNSLICPQSICASKLFDQYRNVPAIVCGSGPSLAKQIPLLKELENKALIIAAGSAISALSTKGIIPHLAAAFGPGILQERVMQNHLAFQTPLIYQNRLNYRVSWEAQNPLLLLNKPESYELAQWLENVLGVQESGSTLGGVSISNFCASLAKDLGCNPIIFTGCDMAYTSCQVYSPGVLGKGQKDAYSQIKKIDTKDIYGQPIKSNYHWLTESEWFSDLKEQHPHISFYNASEGGIGMKGIENIALKDCLPLFEKERDLRGRIHADIQQSCLEISFENILKELSKLYDSLENCIANCDEILEQTLQNLTKLESGEAGIESPESLALKEKMQEESAYQFILSPLEEIFGLSKRQKLYQIKRQSKENPLKSLLEFVRLRTESLVFVKRAAEAHQEMIEDSLEEFEAIKNQSVAQFFET